MLDWDRLKTEFQNDSSNLRDIYVLKTTIDDWQLLFEKLQTLYHLKYTIDGNSYTFPKHITEIFATKDSASPAISFDIGGIIVASHFFTTEEIEFDIWAGEINSEETFDTLLGFLKIVGDITKKNVILTAENSPKQIIISYQSDKQVMRYYPVKT